MKRDQVIQYLINTNKFKKYLEIGVAEGNNYRLISCESKTGVDPKAPDIKAKGFYQMTSDEFFEYPLGNVSTGFDIVFIDGLHLYEQVVKDIVNSLNHMMVGGYIVIHDCKPWPNTCGREPENPRAPWNGDVFRAIIWFKQTHPNFPCFVLDTDWGLGVIHKDHEERIEQPKDVSKWLEYDYKWLSNHWVEYGLVPEHKLYVYVTTKRDIH